MKFLEITLPVHDPSRWVSWLSGHLGTPPTGGHGVRIGWTILHFTTDSSDDPPGRGHHLAFAIPTGSINDAARRIEEETGQPLLSDDGATVIDRGGNWASRSVYFAGPENSVLELIEHTDRPASAATSPSDGPPELLGVAEIGHGVSDVAAAGDNLATRYGEGLPHGFGDPARRVIAAYGDIDGAVILAGKDRPWYPTQDVLPATAEAAFVAEDDGRS